MCSSASTPSSAASRASSTASSSSRTTTSTSVRRLVSGCDVWVNLPRRPLEASGTSGMKATFNGALQLSVLDGWWDEGYDGENGWAIPGEEDGDLDLVDTRDAERFYDLLEQEVVPLFYDRDEAGVPQRWCDRDQARARHLRPRLQRHPHGRRLRRADLPAQLSRLA